MTKGNVTYLSKSEGGRGEALRAEKRGAGGDGERQGFDRGFKYFICFALSSGLHGDHLSMPSIRNASCSSHVHETRLGKRHRLTDKSTLSCFVLAC